MDKKQFEQLTDFLAAFRLDITEIRKRQKIMDGGQNLIIVLLLILVLEGCYRNLT